MSQQKTVLVTGCSSGFGRLMVETLARHGHTTVAGMRDPAGKNASASAELRALAEREHLPLHIVALDVTDDASVQEAVHTAAEKSGGRIDVLVNNAGIASFGITEAFTIEQVARQFDTNVFGPLRMKRAVLPLMRKAGEGLIVEMSTSLARIPMPFMAIYCATKAAEEMFDEEARWTLAPFGIETAIIEASAYPTPAFQHMEPPADGARLAEYGPLFPVMEQLGKSMQYMLASKPDPHEVAEAVRTLVETPRGQRPLRTLVGKHHPPGMREYNESEDRYIEGFLEIVGVRSMLGLKGGRT